MADGARSDPLRIAQVSGVIAATMKSAAAANGYVFYWSMSRFFDQKRKLADGWWVVPLTLASKEIRWAIKRE